MEPSAIKILIEQATLLHNSEPRSTGSTYTAFLTSWVAWEALRTRFIRVVIHHKGWLLKDADKVLAQQRIGSTRHAASALGNVGLLDPDQWSGKSGKGWKALRDIEPLRNRIVHGFKSIEPDRIHAATSVVLCLLSDHEWLSSVPIVDAAKTKERILVGPLLNPRRSSKLTQQRQLEELAKVMKVDLSSGVRPLPSRVHLAKLATDAGFKKNHGDCDSKAL
ncbi:MAG: hypothetical protein HC860_20925 [Alkalinema sp. RU_4_3]|nr:hypothetical protein [Alkalinema sp. RU_4_3]